jgi:hypothetical protein
VAAARPLLLLSRVRFAIITLVGNCPYPWS